MITRRIFLAGMAATAAAGALTAAPAAAQQYLGSYTARLSRRDHMASDGFPLSTAGQILRQDRANYHRFNRRDPGDMYDPWFTTNEDRARLQSMADRSGAMSRATRNAIVNGTPEVQVDVYRNSVEVSIIAY